MTDNNTEIKSKNCVFCSIGNHFKKNNGLRKSQLLTFHALLTAIILVFTIVPITIGPVTLAFLPLLAIIISTKFMGLKHGIISGAVFGLTSFILAMTIYAGTVMAVFQNPLVSILPRLVIAFSVYFVGVLMVQKIKNTIAADTTAAVAGVLTNTILVLLMIFLFNNGKDVHGTVISSTFVLGLIGTNSILEIVFCAILTAPILNVIGKVIKR